MLDDTVQYRAVARVATAATPSKVDMTDLLLGETLHLYRCDALLGWGAMGRVYLAHHVDLHRKCALKVLSPRTYKSDVDYGERFLLEGRTAASLVHPNIVTTHAIGESRGYRFLEMEFVPGRSLQDIVQNEGHLNVERALMVASRIAEGLSTAHRRGVVHRDLKPDNVLISVQGVPKIVDFGLAKRVWRRDPDDAGVLVGTPHYMAPELFSGASATPASDVYSLGVCLYVMLSGRVPYPSGSLQRLMDRVQNDEVPSVRDVCETVPLEVAECVAQMMSKSPTNRPEDATAAMHLVNAVAGDMPDLESLLLSAFAGMKHVSWVFDGQVARVEVRLAEGRRQTVYVEPSRHAVADRLLVIYSRCGSARPDFYEAGLKLNAQISHGGLAIREIDGTPQFVMINTYPRSTVDPDEIRLSVIDLALNADAIEKLLEGTDRY